MDIMTFEQYQEQFREQLERVKQEAVMQAYWEYKAEALLYERSLQAAYEKEYAQGIAEGCAEVEALLKQGISLEELKARYGV